MAVGAAQLLRGVLLKGLARKEMRAREHPVFWCQRQRRAVDQRLRNGAVVLLHGFVPHLGGEVVIAQIGEAARVGGKLGEHALTAPGMQGRQAGAARWCAGFVVELSEHGQRCVVNTHDAVGVASNVPFAVVRF